MLHQRSPGQNQDSGKDLAHPDYGIELTKLWDCDTHEQEYFTSLCVCVCV